MKRKLIWLISTAIVTTLGLMFTTLAVEPVIPDEATKVRALKIGYALNGDSMVRAPYLGSIDVSGLLSEAAPMAKGK